MKKTLLAIFFLATSLFGFAESKTYTDDLVVTINEASSPAQKSDIQVEFLDNNKCNLSLQNFCLGSGEDVIYVGNITLNDITLTEAGDYKTFEVEETINITAGNLPDVAEGDWFGPYLGDVPIKMTGKINDDKLYCLIDIDMMASLEQIIKVTFGSDFADASNTKTYVDDLIVTVNDQSSPAQKSEIKVVFNDNNTCNISLENFCLGSGEDVIYVGNINVDNVELTQEDGYQTFNVERTINIEAGNLPDVTEGDWFGPYLGDVPIKMTGKINDDKLYCLIDIDMMSSLEQIIKVTFGSDITTSVSTVTFNRNGTTNVYTINGVCVAKDVDTIHALNNLKSGVYIVNGQKVIKK